MLQMFGMPWSPRKNFNASKVEIFYYDAYPKDGTRDYNLDGKHKFYTYLKKGLGFTVRKKELKTGGNGYFDLKDINEFWGKDLKHRAKE